MDLIKEDIQPPEAESADTEQPILPRDPDSTKTTTPPTATEQQSHSPNPQITSTYSSASSSVSPTLPPPALFVNALNLQPHSGNIDTTEHTTGF